MTKPTPDEITDLDRFWKAYPRKVGKGAVRKWFNAHKPTTEVVEAMFRAIDVQKQTEQWQKNDGQFIPHPRTWLNQERWEDEVETAVQPANRNNQTTQPVKSQWALD